MRAAFAAFLLLAAPATAAPVCDAVWRDAARGRDIPVRIEMPEGAARRSPVVLWSPGLGGDINGGAAWSQAWVKAGLAVVHLQHPGSGPEVYAGQATPSERRAKVIAGSSPAQLLARIGDVGFVLDELSRRGREGACDLARIDSGRAAIAGHSMGAWVAQALAGQRFQGQTVLADRRFRAALAFSPLAPAGDPKAGFGAIAIPFMVVTGTADGAAPGADAKSKAAVLALHTGVYDGMPADGSKYLLVFDNAEHMMFAGNPWRAKTSPTAAHVQAVSAAVTTAFLARWMLGDKASGTALDGGLKGMLAAGDRWAAK